MRKNKLKQRATSLLLAVLLLLLAIPAAVNAGVPASTVTFGIKSLTVTSSPVEEENYFTVEAVYQASVTNHGWDSSVWHTCSHCGGSGATARYGGSAGHTMEITLTCGQTFEGRTWMCRANCDGYDYIDTNGLVGNVTHNTDDPWDGEHTNNWDDGQTHIWDKASAEPCICSMPVQIDTGANNGFVSCRGCGGVGSIYTGLTDCPDCDDDTQKDCGRCGGTGSIKTFSTCSECSGQGSVTEFLPCTSCGGSGGTYVTVHHNPTEPPNSIKTVVDIALEGTVQDSKEITFSLNTTQHDGYTWTKSGEVTVEWTVFSGEGIGDKVVETTIDKGDEPGERKEIIVNVEPACNLTVEFVPPNSNYRQDTDVVSTFVVNNHNSQFGLDIRPKHRLTAVLTVKRKSDNKIIATVQKDDIVIPKGKSNIVYFKWHVPADIVGEVLLECAINVGYTENIKGVNEDSLSDNLIVVTRTIEVYKTMTTPDTKLELATPNAFNRHLSPTANTAANLINATWSQWEWRNDDYKLMTYSCALAESSAVKAEKKGGWQKNNSGRWSTRSGYGINAVVSAGDKQTATDDMITAVQRCDALVPEFNYKRGANICKSMSITTGGNHGAKFEFPGDKIHYTPIWAPDGKYAPSFYIYDYWSPAGMLSGYTTDYINIVGDMYDDWNSNRR